MPFIKKIDSVRDNMVIILSKLNYPAYYINKDGKKVRDNKNKTIREKISSIQEIIEICLKPDYIILPPKGAYSNSETNPFDYDDATKKSIKKQLENILVNIIM